MLLGLGEDGHVASLFPGRPELAEKQRIVVAVHDSPKPPPIRLTLTPAAINAAREVHLLVAGAPKRVALEAVLDGKVLDWTAGNVMIWTDRQAAALA